MSKKSKTIKSLILAKQTSFKVMPMSLRVAKSDSQKKVSKLNSIHSSLQVNYKEVSIEGQFGPKLGIDIDENWSNQELSVQTNIKLQRTK